MQIKRSRKSNICYITPAVHMYVSTNNSKNMRAHTSYNNSRGLWLKHLWTIWALLLLLFGKLKVNSTLKLTPLPNSYMCVEPRFLAVRGVGWILLHYLPLKGFRAPWNHCINEKLKSRTHKSRNGSELFYPKCVVVFCYNQNRTHTHTH